MDFMSLWMPTFLPEGGVRAQTLKTHYDRACRKGRLPTQVSAVLVESSLCSCTANICEDCGKYCPDAFERSIFRPRTPVADRFRAPDLDDFLKSLLSDKTWQDNQDPKTAAARPLPRRKVTTETGTMP